LRDEENVVLGEDEDNEAAWEGWDVESDSSSDSDSEDWINVDDDDDKDLHISDSEDEDKPKATPVDAEMDVVDPATRISTLATTKVQL
jgi:protein SDA1